MSHTPLRAASLQEHFWQLESGEARHAAHPGSFWIPPRAAREGLQRGKAAKLLFDIEGEGEHGVERATERMWVIVAERVGTGYIGILDNQPAVLDPGPGVYLVVGAEVPFWPEHVIDIADPPPDWIDLRLGTPPTRRWPREQP